MHPLTKKALYMKAMTPIFGIAAALGICSLVIITALYFANSVLSFPAHLLLGFFAASLFFIILLGVCSPSPLKGIKMISTQESFLGFCFKDEMEKYNISTTDYRSNEWFIDTSRVNVTAFRRDFICTLENISEHPGSRGMLLHAEVVCADGKVRVIIGSHNSITTFQQWLIG